MEDDRTMNEMQTDSTSTNVCSEDKKIKDGCDEMSRRKALTTLGKFALLTTPVMTTLLTSKKAAAFSPTPPSPPSF
ncbi:MAG: hypothetical protein GY862_27295 [Gammaproteobacteria bacterium]|nr:hypothetical protein [Gammaproteobacteria bacterium]